jgi:hypothetical protein
MTLSTLSLSDYLSFRGLQDIPVVPVRKKRPLISWKKWINAPQTDEEKAELFRLFNDRDDSIRPALLCGVKTSRGYFCAIDIDPDPTLENRFGQEIRGLAVALYIFLYARGVRSQADISPRGGLHIYFFSRSPVPTIKIRGLPIELHGKGSLITIYTRTLNDVIPTIVEDGFKMYYTVVKLLGLDTGVIGNHFVSKIPRHENFEQKHNAILEKVVTELERRGLVKRRGLNYFSCLCPFHEEKHASFAINHRKFYAVDYHDGRVYNLLELAEELGIKLSDKKLKSAWIVGPELVDEYLVEVVAGPRLLLYNSGSHEMVVVESFDRNGLQYRPYPDLPFMLPEKPNRVGPDSTLWSDTKEFIRAYFDHLDERVYDLMTAAVAWSYFYRDIKGSTPYILFLGPWRSGKTRALEVLESICYKAVRVVDPSEASLFRSIELLRPTLLIDESQIVDENVRAVMASGYRYGSKVMRVLDPEADGFDGIKFYDTFAFVIYASREEPPSDIFSRSITIHCEKNIRPTLKRIDEARALELRTRWLAQRLCHFGMINITFEEFQSDDGRLQELFSPLMVMAQTFGDNEAAKSIESYGRQVERGLRDYESSTPEAELVEAVARIVEEREGDAPEVVLTSEILERLNNREWTPHRVGKRMTALGFKRYRSPDGRRGYLVDLSLLARLKMRFGLASQP